MSVNKDNLEYFYRDLIVSSFNALDLGVHILDNNGITVLYNAKCEEIEGIENQWIIGSDMKILVRDGVYSESVGLEAIKKRKTISKAQRVNEKYIYSTAVPIFKGDELISVVISVIDVTNMQELKDKLARVEKINKRIQNELDRLKTQDNQEDFLVTQSKAMEKIYDLASRISMVDSNILIEGESGVGKGVLCKFIHDNSPRRDKPFIKIDCGSLVPSLIESELFGYEEGAFTGARKEGRKGLIEMAQGGTLFLDEIGELPLNLQVKLLSVIQDKKLQRVGGNDFIDVDIRIISATNRELLKMVEENKFRQDLYYRLKVVYIEIPPIRRRKEDIVHFINIFLERFNKKYNLSKIISSQAMKLLINYSWPGNIREIENEMERLVVTTASEIIDDIDVLDGSLNGDNLKLDSNANFRENVLKYEKDLLKDYIRRSKDINDLSEKTGLEQSSLRKKTKRLGLELKFGE